VASMMSSSQCGKINADALCGPYTKRRPADRALGGRPVGWGSQGGPSSSESKTGLLRVDVVEDFRAVTRRRERIGSRYGERHLA
jgi:hypothetical protein